MGFFFLYNSPQVKNRIFWGILLRSFSSLVYLCPKGSLFNSYIPEDVNIYKRTLKKFKADTSSYYHFV